MNSNRLPFLAAISLHFLALSPSLARGALLVDFAVDVEQSGPAQYRYQYTLSNKASSSASIAALGIEKAKHVTGTTLTSPTNWVPNFPPSSTASTIYGWEAKQDLTALILPGHSAIFAMLSPYAPGVKNYVIIGANVETFFQEISSGMTLAPLETADFDANGMVDGVDFLAWQRGFGRSFFSGIINGDSNGDQLVTNTDLTVWMSRYGDMYSPSIHRIPEPTYIFPTLLTGILATARVLRRHNPEQPTLAVKRRAAIV